jgi:hypothetical protein
MHRLNGVCVRTPARRPPLFNTVCRLDLKGIVAKRMDDGYGPKTQWFKILNPTYSQKEGRAELFERRYA